MKENKEIRRAKEEYEFLTGKEAERRIAFLRDKAIKDENNIRKREKEKGRKERERCESIALAEFFRRDAERIKF